MFKKRGQVTIFIIIGIVILFAFLFVFMLSSKITKGKLEGQRDAIFSDAFNKEPLRIFVEDCIKDELENGLITYGSQGKFFSDDPGGIINFVQDENGVLFSQGAKDYKVYYAIVDEDYSEHSNAYPCNDEENSGFFCAYSYPDASVGFGNLKLKLSSMDRDLKNYLKSKTKSCVTSFTRAELSEQIEIEGGDMEMELIITNDAISVDVNYPLNMKVGGNDFFHLAKFDFVYPTKFKQFLNSAILFPLRLDQKYVDFNYNVAVDDDGAEIEGVGVEGDFGDLDKGSFVYKSSKELTNCESDGVDLFDCTQPMFNEQYENLNVELERFEQDNGDNVFEFSTSFGNVVRVPGDYIFRFARENRPPALDYVGRGQCLDIENYYDYLIIKGDSDFGGVDIELNANDPDEDNIIYSFEAGVLEDFVDEDVGASGLLEVGLEEFNLPKGRYDIKSRVVDEHGKEDFQDVKVVVDRPLTTNIKIDYPGLFVEGEGDELVSYASLFEEDVAFVSKVDPFCLNISLPQESFLPFVAEDIRAKLSYEGDLGSEVIVLPSRVEQLEGEDVYGFPLEQGRGGDLVATCDFENVDSRFNDLMVGSGVIEEDDFEKFPFVSLGEVNLDLTYGIDYCNLEDPMGSVSSIAANVVSCIPHRNENQPFAYPYHTYVVGDDGSFSIDEDASVYTATRSCCLGGANNPNGWGLVDANNPSFSCFVNPEPGCYSQVTKGDGTPFTGIRNNRGLVLEKQERLCGEKGTCDGNSNNKFDDGAGREVMTCGSEVNGAECNLGAIADSCEGKPSFSLVEGVGWCHGDMGCSTSQCSEVIRKDGFEFEVGNVIESDFMAILATTNFIDNEDDLRFPFACGCPEGDVGRDQDEDELTNIVCDNNFDGRFEGRCSLAGACLGDGVE